MDLFYGYNDAMHVWTLEEPLPIVETIMLTNCKYSSTLYYTTSMSQVFTDCSL